MNPGDKISNLVGNGAKLSGDADFANVVRKGLVGILLATSLVGSFGMAAGQGTVAQEQAHATATAPKAGLVSAKSENGRAEVRFQVSRSFDVKVDHETAGKLAMSYDASSGMVTIEKGGNKTMFDTKAMQKMPQTDYVVLKQGMAEKSIAGGQVSPLDNYAVDGGKNFDMFVYKDGKIMLQDRGAKAGDTAVYYMFDAAQNVFSMEKYGVRDNTGHVVEDAKLGETVLVQNLTAATPQARQKLER